jgi:hypothetical protein
MQSKRQVHITWHATPPSPAQLVTWDRLWTRLLGHVGPDKETPTVQASSGQETRTLETVDREQERV